MRSGRQLGQEVKTKVVYRWFLALSLQLTSFGLHACLLGKQNHLLFRKWANEVLNNFAV